MSTACWMIGLTLCLQVPPPGKSQALAVELKDTSRKILTRETSELTRVAERLSKSGDDAAAAEARKLLPPIREPNGADRLVPLPEVVPSSSRGLASIASGISRPVKPDGERGWRSELEEIRSGSAADFFALAKRAASADPPHLARAIDSLRRVIERQPDHAEARRILGYVPYREGWARPFAVRRFQEGNVNHSTYGWVPAEWVPHLEAGELPAPGSRGQRTRWLPAERADELRSNWSHPWQIATEHFEIQTDVPLGEAIGFARRLEAFHDVFFTLLADVVGENLPAARRFRSPSLTGDATYSAHRISYFATKDEYTQHLSPMVGRDIEGTLGYYDPPRPRKGNRGTAYFFRDLNGQLPVTATLYHEVSHQLLFESAGANAFTKNAGNYWVFEGLGTYFETVAPQPDGTLEIGGLVGERIAAARRSLDAGRFLPLDQFLLLDQRGFNRPDRIHTNYQQAMALAVFLMQWNDEAYRENFLDYVRDAYLGRIRRTTGRSLEDRVGEPVRALDSQFRGFLAPGQARR